MNLILEATLQEFGGQFTAASPGMAPGTTPGVAPAMPTATQNVAPGSVMAPPAQQANAGNQLKVQMLTQLKQPLAQIWQAISMSNLASKLQPVFFKFLQGIGYNTTYAGQRLNQLPGQIRPGMHKEQMIPNLNPQTQIMLQNLPNLKQVVQQFAGFPAFVGPLANYLNSNGNKLQWLNNALASKKMTPQQLRDLVQKAGYMRGVVSQGAPMNVLPA